MLKDAEGRIWATISEVAQLFKVSRQRLQKLAQTGKIDAIRFSRRFLLIDFEQAKFWRERFYSEGKAQAKRKRKTKKRKQK